MVKFPVTALALCSALLLLETAKAETFFVDTECQDFCDTYFKICQSSNAYTNPSPSDIVHRQLVTSAEPILHRLNNGSSFSKDILHCQMDCMLYPRPASPDEYVTPLKFGSNLGSDTFWCRKRHLSLAARVEGNSFNDPTFHCYHAGPTGGSICRDVQIDGATPYEYLRDGQDTRHHIAYCDLAGNNTVADCTQMYITDDTLPYALQWLPSTVQYLLLNGNPGITNLTAGIFKNNLENPKGLKALFMDECNITFIDSRAFAGLDHLEALNLNMNLMTSFPEKMLEPTRRLRQLSAITSGSKYASLVGLPDDLFSYTPNMQRIIIYGHASITSFPANIFRNLTECQIISFVNCGFTNAGFPDGVFSDMTSLMYFDFFGNKLTKVEKRWFSGSWGKNVLRLALDTNQITSVETGALDSLINLEVLYLHRNKELLTIPKSVIANNTKLRHLTLQGNQDYIPAFRDRDEL
ncbi:hypothetical protein MPSEU_000177500 [Mayamaea pseudoterrestris]|nr:hypothetical protein MPSEU_000177500 [Mayamaea pseudoterrestris]